MIASIDIGIAGDFREKLDNTFGSAAFAYQFIQGRLWVDFTNVRNRFVVVELQDFPYSFWIIEQPCFQMWHGFTNCRRYRTGFSTLAILVSPSLKFEQLPSWFEVVRIDRSDHAVEAIVAGLEQNKSKLPLVSAAASQSQSFPFSKRDIDWSV